MPGSREAAVRVYFIKCYSINTGQRRRQATAGYSRPGVLLDRAPRALEAGCQPGFCPPTPR